MKGKTIYISYAEYEAICSILDEVETNSEGADEVYLEGERLNIKCLYNIISKFKGIKVISKRVSI
jgi:hypothetical protein